MKKLTEQLRIEEAKWKKDEKMAKRKNESAVYFLNNDKESTAKELLYEASKLEAWAIWWKVDYYAVAA